MAAGIGGCAPLGQAMHEAVAAAQGGKRGAMCSLGGCAAEGPAAATRKKTFQCAIQSGITACARGTTPGLPVPPDWPRFARISLRPLLPRRFPAHEAAYWRGCAAARPRHHGKHTRRRKCAAWRRRQALPAPEPERRAKHIAPVGATLARRADAMAVRLKQTALGSGATTRLLASAGGRTRRRPSACIAPPHRPIPDCRRLCSRSPTTSLSLATVAWKGCRMASA